MLKSLRNNLSMPNVLFAMEGNKENGKRQSNYKVHENELGQ
jgi:hypothetical protein